MDPSYLGVAGDRTSKGGKGVRSLPTRPWFSYYTVFLNDPGTIIGIQRPFAAKLKQSEETAREDHKMGTILLIILILLLIGAVPAWPHSRGWGYYPSGGLGLVLLIIVILLLLGYV
jgi:hypothetical protein